MSAFLLRRLAWMFPTTLGVVVLVFLAFHLVPGDPALMMMGSSAQGSRSDVDDAARAAEFRRRHGLDRPLVIQLLDYIGPFNLMRDGHRWFSPRRSERSVESMPLVGGGVSREGVLLELDPLPDTPAQALQRMRAAVAVLQDERAPGQDRSAARVTLKAEGRASLPLLLNALRESPGESTQRQELSETLAELTGHAPEVPPERARALGALALPRHWYGWYYTHGGDRVRGTGERPWSGLLAFDLGLEMQRRTSVAAELGRRLKVTVPLALAAILLSYLIALPLGVFGALRRGTRTDTGLGVALFLLDSIPAFWAGLMLILLFGATGPDWSFWPQLPILGLHDQDASELGRWAFLKDTLAHCILPVATMTYGSLAYLSRQMRSSMLEVLGQDFIRLARAKGLPEHQVIVKHALRNALLPLVTLFGSILPILIGGSVIVETVFDLPGMGKYAYEGLLRRDIPIVMATTILVAVTTQLGMILSDAVYILVDPRIRHE